MKSVAANHTDLAIKVDILPGPDLDTSANPNIFLYRVVFYYEPNAGRWFAQGGTDRFMLLSSAVVDALILEAVRKGYPVWLLNAEGTVVHVITAK